MHGALWLKFKSQYDYGSIEVASNPSFFTVWASAISLDYRSPVTDHFQKSEKIQFNFFRISQLFCVLLHRMYRKAILIFFKLAVVYLYAHLNSC